MTANLVLGGARDGIGLDTFEPDVLPLTDTVIRANVVRGAAVDGISVGTETNNPIPDTRIEANQVGRAGDDGIDVPAPAPSSARNGRPQRRPRHQRDRRRDRRRQQPRLRQRQPRPVRQHHLRLTCAAFPCCAQLTLRSQPSRDGATPSPGQHSRRAPGTPPITNLSLLRPSTPLDSRAQQTAAANVHHSVTVPSAHGDNADAGHDC